MILVILIVLLKQTEGLSLGPWRWPKKGLDGWSWLWRNTLHPYSNNNLTVKPIGSPGTSTLYNHWKNKEKQWKIEYDDKNINVNMDNVTGIIDTQLSLLPVKNNININVISDNKLCTKNRYAPIPKMKQGVPRPLMDSQIDDNYNTLIINA